MKFRTLYTLSMVLLGIFLVYTISTKNWLQTDLTALLPQEQQPDVVLQAADAAHERQLNTQVVLLVGSQDADRAFQTAAQIAQLWQQSGVFTQVDSRVAPDLTQLRHDIQQLSLATLPQEQRQQLWHEPERYFQERAEAAINPFASPSPLSLEQDWLGLGRFVTQQARPQSRLQWHADTGMLFTEDEQGKTWVWLRGRLSEQHHLANGHAGLLPLLAQSRAWATQHQVETLSAGGAVFAAASKAAAEQESKWMSATGLLLTFVLLLWVFRSGRLSWLLLPLAMGMLTGLAAVLLVLGEVHILTIVIGTSLVGMLVDFPLHWLAPSLFATEKQVWQAQTAMRHVLPTFAISLLITVVGYAFLWFTPLPVLRQTAVFSGFALLGAFGATVLWLPPLFTRYQAKSVPFTKGVVWLNRAVRSLQQGKAYWVVGLGLAVWVLVGVWRSDWRDDIRQWVNMPPQLLAEAQQIGQLAGTDWGGQYIVVEAASEDALLQKNAAVRQVLQPLIAQQKLHGMQSLDQWLLPTTEQRQLQQRLGELAQQPAVWQAMNAIGVPSQTMRDALQQAAQLPTLTLSDGVQPALAEAWRGLYLGEVAPHRFAAIIRLHGLNDTPAIQTALQPLTGVYWAEKRSHLNTLFHETRNQAAWLKLASYGLAMVVLWWMLGVKRGSQVLAVPLLSAVGTVAMLGWLGIPISLFAMFGLLLVSAIGVDYAVYAVAAQHSSAARLGGMLLAALTTGISFVLLGISSTPAVAAFGLTVTLGVLWNLGLVACLLNKPSNSIITTESKT